MYYSFVVPFRDPVERAIVGVCALGVRLSHPVGIARKGPNSVRLVPFAVVAAYVSRADNVLRIDTPPHVRFLQIGALVEEAVY